MTVRIKLMHCTGFRTNFSSIWQWARFWPRHIWSFRLHLRFNRWYSKRSEPERGETYLFTFGMPSISESISLLQTSVVEVHSLKEQSIVPSPGDIVTARVLIVKSRQCLCEIKCIGETTLTRPYRAVLRQEDVRATEKDRVKMYESFAPGDIILARVVSFAALCPRCHHLYFKYAPRSSCALPRFWACTKYGKAPNYRMT
jgi:hypothetical protein